MNKVTEKLLNLISDPSLDNNNAYSIRENSCSAGMKSTEHIKISSKVDGKSGIDIFISSEAQNELVSIPACITKSNVKEKVYNDFYVSDGANVTIVAGCGVNTDDSEDSMHEGIHRFFIGKNAHVEYREKHIGIGEGTGKRILNPESYIEIDDGGSFTMDSIQIKGVDSTIRNSTAILGKDAKIVIKEKIMTHDDQYAETNFNVDLNGENSSANLISRSVAEDRSKQSFNSIMNGNNKCVGHSECDAIIMDNAIVNATPALTAANTDAQLIHEAAIGKIAGDQLIKLMSLGLSEAEAEKTIIDGFMS